MAQQNVVFVTPVNFALAPPLACVRFDYFGTVGAGPDWGKLGGRSRSVEDTRNDGHDHGASGTACLAIFGVPDFGA